MNERIAKYKLDQSIEILGRFGFAHIFFILLILPWMFGDWRAQGHILYIAISAIIFLLLPRFLNPSNPKHNALLVLVYLGLVFIELITCGIPSVLVETQHQISKGVMFEMLMALLPWVYIGVRVFMFLPLLVLFFRSKAGLNFNLS